MGSSLKEGFVWVRIPAHGLKFQSELNSFMYNRFRTTSKAAHSPTQVWKPLSHKMLTLSHAELKLVFICWLLPTAYGILVPWPGIEPLPPAVEAWSLNHWTSEEVPELKLLCSLLWVIQNSVFGEEPLADICLFFFFKDLLIFLFLAMLGLCCCIWAFSSCGACV